MCSEGPDGLFINVCEVQATCFHPSTEVNCGVQIATDCQRCVADRRHRGSEAFKIASRTPRIHVMGVRQKFGNLHVVLSGPPVRRPSERLRYAEFDIPGHAVYGEVDLETAGPGFVQPRISMDGAYLRPSTGSMATSTRICGVIWIIPPLPPSAQ